MKDAMYFALTTLSFAIFFDLSKYFKRKKDNTKIPIAITRVMDDKNLIEFTLESETKNHLRLGKELVLISGLECKESNDLPLLMNLGGRYSFRLKKKKFIEWQDIMPQIKKTFVDYFKSVEFLGDFPDKTIKTKKRTASSLL